MYEKLIKAGYEIPDMVLSFVLNLPKIKMAPQVGFEPKTPRLTAECSTVELLRNFEFRQRPTLPEGPPSSTIGAEGLNFCVRNGYRCFPFAIVTGIYSFRCKSQIQKSLSSLPSSPASYPASSPAASSPLTLLPFYSHPLLYLFLLPTSVSPFAPSKLHNAKLISLIKPSAY